MNDIYGIPMTTILLVTVAIMSLCLLTVAGIAWRSRVVFRMALRNIPRRKAQTVLITIGLMLSTLIIAASLTTGDTLSHSLTRSTYDALGQVDQTIAFVGDAGGEGAVSTENVPIPVSVVEQLEERFAGDPDVDGFMPVLTVGAPVDNPGSGLSEPSTVITGVDGDRLPAFGGLETPGGEPIAFGSLPAGSAVISESLAESVNAGVGERVRFFYGNQPMDVTVGAIARDSILTGYQAGTEQAGPTQAGSVDLTGMAVPLEWLQDLTGMQGQASFIAVSNAGGVESGVDSTDVVVEKLQVALSEIDGGQALGVNPLKQDALDAAEQLGSVFLTFFMLFGTFSIAAGILLIFLIFMMLAAERRSEMGMARAVGMKRGQLIQGFISEGAAYDLGAALVGAATGVLVAFAVASALGSLLGGFVDIAPYANWRSLVIAYALGVSVTFLTIIFASVRSSRLNIVAAIRDLPDESNPERGQRPTWQWWSSLMGTRPRLEFSLSSLLALPIEFVWNVLLIGPKVLIWLARLLAYFVGWGPIIGVAGGLFIALGVAEKLFFAFSLGVSLLVLGMALTLRRYVPARPVYTAAAAFMLLYWLLPFDVTQRVLPDVGEGGPEMFFVSGIFMVAYLVLIIMWNADLIVGLVSLSGRTFARWLPAVKTAVAYPLASKGRTGLTIAMFAMVIFSIVTVRTISVNFSELIFSDAADAGWDVVVTTSPSNPVDDLEQRLVQDSVDVSAIDAVGRIETVAPDNSQVRNTGDGEWRRYTINGMDTRFVERANIPLQARAEGYGSDAAVWDAINSGQRVAIVDSAVLESDGFGSEGDQLRYLAPEDLEVTGGSFPAFKIELQNPESRVIEQVTVIGVIDTRVSVLSGLYLPDPVFAGLYGDAGLNRFYIRLAETAPGSPEQVAQDIEAGLQASGVQAVSIQEQLDEQQAFADGFFTLMQGFMGLGLFVGVAALGVISFRSVIERRQQIGMLRAIGYKREMVAASFLLESLIVALLGLVSGATLAVILAYNLVTSGELGEEFGSFVIPWSTILFFIVAGLIAAAVTTWIPARKASSLPIAEALRYE